MRFAFVLLQYKNLSETVTCVRSLRPLLENDSAVVVVVDNFSTEEVAEQTRSAFEGLHGVTVLTRPVNDGYAKGNNAGYRYAVETLKADFVGVFNNDTEVFQENFCHRVERIYRQTGFSVLGPDIRVQAPGGLRHQNPSMRIRTAEQIRALLNRSPSDERGKVLRLPGKRKKVWFRKQNLILHGAALIFSPRFLQDFDEPFDPRTFLYSEEAILYHRATKRGHKFLYDPALVVWHRVKVAEYKSASDYLTWRRSIERQSYEVLLSYLEETPGEP